MRSLSVKLQVLVERRRRLIQTYTTKLTSTAMCLLWVEGLLVSQRHLLQLALVLALFSLMSSRSLAVAC